MGELYGFKTPKTGLFRPFQNKNAMQKEVYTEPYRECECFFKNVFAKHNF